jgi:hypothetical protein
MQMRWVVSNILLLVTTGLASAQKADQPTASQLSAVTQRGRLVAAYDRAAWFSTEAVMKLEPTNTNLGRYIARQGGSGWVVAYGHLNETHDRFLTFYEATQGDLAEEFNVKSFDPPRQDTGFNLAAAIGIQTVVADFKSQPRPYNVVVLPADQNRMWIYMLPAQTKNGVYPLGPDVRYLISTDGATIVEKRQLHSAYMEFLTPPPTERRNLGAGVHTTTLDNVPEDTDVAFVMMRQPLIREMVATPKFVYEIQPDGQIKFKGKTEKFHFEGGSPAKPQNATPPTPAPENGTTAP